MYVEEGGYPTRLQGCFHNQPIQTEKEILKSVTTTEISLSYQLAKILFNRMKAHLDQARLIPESQCGFRKDRGTIDMILKLDNFKRNAKSKICEPPYYLCRPNQSI